MALKKTIQDFGCMKRVIQLKTDKKRKRFVQFSEEKEKRDEFQPDETSWLRFLLADTIFGERLQHPSPFTQAFSIFIIWVNILTFPFTAVLNALVMIAVNL